MTGTQRNSFRRLHFDIYFFLLCIFFFDYTSFIHLIVYLYAWDQKWWSSITNIIPMICLQNRRYYATYPVPYSNHRCQKVNDQNYFIWCEFWQIYSYCIFFSRGIGRWRGLPIIPESSYDLEKKGREHRTGGDISQLIGMYKRIFKTRNKMASQKCKPHNHTYIAIMKELNSTDLGICPLIEEKRAEISFVMKLT